MLQSKELSIFEDLVYQATSKIARGKVSTYAQIAKEIGREKSYHAVGNALHKNPFAPLVPCHRVVYSTGRLGEYAFGKKKKMALLKEEGIIISNDQIVDFQEKLFKF
ncbi:MAG: MGMT family protein [Clostridia bacterium]|nr:MGMT family protein [Clostridia bacterium]